MSQIAVPNEAQADLPTKAELLIRIEAAWSELEQTLAAVPQAQVTTLRDDQGWSAKDHLVHITTWEQSLLALLQGRDRHQAIGLGDMDESAMKIDDINAYVFQRNQHRSLEDVMAAARRSHQQVMATLNSLSDADLLKPYSHYQPQDLPYEAAPVIGWINGNTWEHYREHSGWIRGLGST